MEKANFIGVFVMSDFWLQYTQKKGANQASKHSCLFKKKTGVYYLHMPSHFSILPSQLVKARRKPTKNLKRDDNNWKKKK